MAFEKYNDLQQAAQQVGARLIAVSKTKPVSAIQALYERGQRMFGESKVQELLQKQEQLPNDIAWHLIGHLQTNKVKYVVPIVALIHSVDSLKLLKEIDRQAGAIHRVQDCLLQLYIATESTKYGLSMAEAEELLASAEYRQLHHIRICGLMGMATNTDDETQIRSEFKTLKAYFVKLKATYFADKPFFSELSMGMSADYHIALQEGATLIRVGSILFGARQ